MLSPNQHFLSLKGKSVMAYPVTGNPPGGELGIVGFLINLFQGGLHRVRQGGLVLRVVHLELQHESRVIVF